MSKTPITTSIRGQNTIDNAKASSHAYSDDIRIIPNTTTINYKSSSVVSDVSVAALMRAVPVDFTAFNLRPGRKVYPFFDNKDISNLIEKPNKIVLDTRIHYQTMITGPIANTHYQYSNGSISTAVDTTREEVFIYGKKASVLFSEVDVTGNTVLYISHLQPRTLFNPGIDGFYNSTFTQQVVSTVASNIGPGIVSATAIYAADALNSNSVVSVKTGQLANIVSYQHHSGIAKVVTVGDLNRLYADPSANGEIIIPSEVSAANIKYGTVDAIRLRLSEDASTVDNFYNGNTITFVNGYAPGAVANIVSYNGATQIAEISLPVVSDGRPWRGITPSTNTIYTIGDAKSPFSTSNLKLSHYTTQSGFLAGTFHIPDPNNTTDFRFRVGDRILSITDTPTNNPDDATTAAEYRFSSATIDTVIRQIPSSNNRAVGTPGRAGLTSSLSAPIAQSFYVSPDNYPQGMFIPYIDVFFANKGILPVTMQIRPLTNGLPDSNIILPNAFALVQAEDVNVSTSPNVNSPNTYTRFAFPSPVYVAPDQDYAFLVITNDFDYDIYVSELGEKIIGTDRVVSQQPYVGSLFKAQSATTYDAIQSEDIMFVIHKCVFNQNGSIVLSEEKDVTQSAPYYNRANFSNVAFDAFEVHSDSVELPGTGLVFSYKSVSNATNTVDAEYTQFKPDMRTFLPERKNIYGKAILQDSFAMKVDLTSTSADVSPIISLEKQNLGTLTTVINNMGIDFYRVSVKNSGNNYTSQNTTIVFTSNTSGQGAEGKPVILTERVPTGKIGAVNFSSQGFGYFDDVKANIVSTDANVSNAVIIVDTELGKSGGPAAAKYISKTVTLAPEFDAGDLRVYLTAVKPPEANIQIYYKVHNKFDNESIAEKNWVKMTQRMGEINFSSRLNPIELEFRPSMNSNNIIYTTNTATFDTFNQFKIKIVMSSTDTVWTKIPFIYDMRAIALPADTR
jgi:hypothetical protein